MWQVLFQKYGLREAVRLAYTDILSDFIQGIDTARPVANQRLTSPSLTQEHHRYVPSTYSAINSALEHISARVDFNHCGFLDYGSGKGKALIAAARHPFTQVTGVELSHELHDIAIANIQRLELDARINCIQGNAASHAPSPDDLVLYFFNPFSGSVLEHCLETIADASRGISRQIIYLNPTEDEVFSRYFDKWDEVNFAPGNVEVNFYATR